MEELLPIMKKAALKKPAKIVICEGWDERCLKSTHEIFKENLGEIVLLGNPDEIKKKAEDLGLDISKAEIHDFKNSPLKQELAEKLVELRKHKGMTLEKANSLLADENYFGCMYASAGYADAIAGSAIYPTAALMRPALQILRKKDSLVSEVGILKDKIRNQIMFETDGSLNPEPDAEQLAKMALNAIECVREFGIEPRVALLSYSTKGSGGNSPEIETIREAVAIVKKNDPEVLIDGELQFDAAVNPKVAPKKCPDSPLKGTANVIVFPNLTAANIALHGFAQMCGIEMEFSVLKGMEKPVAILGRSTVMETVFQMIVSLAMQVNSK